jgi:hypothetical protein
MKTIKNSENYEKIRKKKLDKKKTNDIRKSRRDKEVRREQNNSPKRK